MVNFDIKEFCCGCGACANKCPHKAISMKADDNGFLSPQIDTEKCTNCGLCDIVCPHLNAKTNISQLDKGAWLYSSDNSEAKLLSSSGGAFYELAKAFIEKCGLVVGCSWNDNLEAEHVIIDNVEELKKLQGSKYVQSNTKNIYQEILKEILKGNKVLFSGTPCQVSAAHNYISSYKNGKYREQLLTVGVICHGISSPKVWNSFKTWISNKEKSKLVGVNFRDKSREGYKKSYCKYIFESGKILYQPTFLPSSKYMESTIVYNLAIRNCCSHCDCKGINGACDIILGDWYAEYSGKGSLGTSCIVAFTNRGKLFAENNLKDLRSFSYNEVLDQNSFIEKSVKISPRRDEFLSKLNDDIWDGVEEFYPKKYIVKKLLVKIGIFDSIKRNIALIKKSLKDVI